MKINHIKDIRKFFDVIDSCDGTVELIVGDQMRLNLKSKLSQYVSLAEMFAGGNELRSEIEIVCHNPVDGQRLLNFLIND